MEYKLKKNSIGTLVTYLDTISEQPVDIDFTLPDYCPDIEKILRCKVTPKIYNHSFSGGQLQIDGTTVVTVLYVDSQNFNLRTCEHSVPFNASFQINDAPEYLVADVNTKVEYINCRALSQRRLALHGAFSLYVKAMSTGNLDLCSPEIESDLEYKTAELDLNTLSSLTQCQFSAGDDITISNKPPVEVILTSDVSSAVTDYKIMTDKLMLNGELSVKLLYLSNVQESKIHQIDCIIPFSQVLDCENLTDSHIASLSLKTMSYDVRLKTEMLSDNPVVSVDAKLCAIIYGYNTLTVPVVEDAYSTNYATELTRKSVNLLSNVNVVKDSFIQKETVQLENCNITSICDISNDYCTTVPTINGDSLSLNTKMNVCILAFDEDNKPIYIERAIDFNKEIIVENTINNILNVTTNVVSISYRINESNSLELRCEFSYTITLSAINSTTLVSTVNCIQEQEISKKECALTLYYGKAGEKIWDIAKKYNTKQKLLYQENNLQADVLDNTQMLLIPMV